MIRLNLLLLFILGNLSAVGRGTLMYISAEPITCNNHGYNIEITQFSYNGSTVIFGGLEIVYGDGRVESYPDSEFTTIVEDDNRAITKYVKKHVFQGPGVYNINARFFNRSADIVNMKNSVNTPFYVRTMIRIDPFLGCNATPELENFPLTNKSNAPYLHDFSFIDDEDDSLSFHFTTPLQDMGIPVIDYWLPQDYDSERHNRISKISIDPFQGSLFLNSQSLENDYTLALIINEWRKVGGVYYQMSSSTFDFQMEFRETENNYPAFQGLQDTAIIIDRPFVHEIIISDPENDSIRINEYGNFFQLRNILNEINYKYELGPVTKRMEFTPGKSLVRNRPYKVIYSATDINREKGSLNITKSMHIWITDREHVPAPPWNFMAQVFSKQAINLYWNDSEDELGYILERADKYFPSYERLAILPANTTYYNDSSVVENNTYQYRIRAVGTTMSAYKIVEVSTPEVITMLHEKNMNLQAKIYPNPSNGSFYINPGKEINYLEILDLSGKKVWERNLSGDPFLKKYAFVDNELSKGTYLVNFIGKTGKQIQKLIIN